MKPVGLKVQFEGVVTVLVPDHLCHNNARLLARNLALARILVTADTPHDPFAFYDYGQECSATGQRTAREDWAAAKIAGIDDGGVMIPDTRPNFTDEGIQRDDGSILEYPDPHDGEIRLTDEEGVVEEVRKPGEEGYREWYDLFDGGGCFFLGQRVHVQGKGDGEVEDKEDDGWRVNISGQRVWVEFDEIRPFWDDE